MPRKSSPVQELKDALARLRGEVSSLDATSRGQISDHARRSAERELADILGRTEKLQRRIDPIAHPALASLVDRTVLVPDEDTLATSRDLLLSQKILTEPSGALAAAGARMVPAGERGLSVAILTGASVGAAGIERLLNL